MAPGWEELLEVKAAVEEALVNRTPTPQSRDHAERSLTDLIDQIRPAIAAARLRDPADGGPLSPPPDPGVFAPVPAPPSPLVNDRSRPEPQNIVTYSGLIIDLDLILPEG